MKSFGERKEGSNLSKQIFTIVHPVKYGCLADLKNDAFELKSFEALNHLKPLSINIFKELLLKTLGR